AVLLLLAACGSPPAASARHSRARRPATPMPATDVVAHAAARFMRLMEEGTYSAQWALLSPTAQAQWPSAAARGQALAAKFKGMTIEYSLSLPVSGQTWASGETLTRVPGLWEVPCSVALSGGPAQLPGTAADFESVPLYLSLAGGHALIVGEGAASVDAPVLLPAAPFSRRSRYRC
ncbi:MAG: hypothetical protein ACREQM_17895, partial [Candidatus Dormibacteraceae bacterium]